MDKRGERKASCHFVNQTKQEKKLEKSFCKISSITWKFSGRKKSFKSLELRSDQHWFEKLKIKHSIKYFYLSSRSSFCLECGCTYHIFLTYIVNGQAKKSPQNMTSTYMIHSLVPKTFLEHKIPSTNIVQGWCKIETNPIYF